jgi:predicted nuclease of predicted toxin-antitoxin system
MHASSDIEVLERARQEDRVIVSADSDFGVILASQATSHPSFILFRKPNLLQAQDYIDLLTPVLQALEPELASGCVAVFRDERLRVRKLPFSD